MIFDGNKKDNLEKAVETLKKGELVVFPTETVYGLGADTYNISALEKVFKLKNRPMSDPLIVHIGNPELIHDLVVEVPEKAKKLIKKYWPGPLTLVLEKKSAVPDLATAGLKFVGVRCPKHPIAQQLLQLYGGPIAAPSANKFQSLSPTTAEAAFESLNSSELMVLDGGPCEVGIESTVVRFEGDNVEILRPGGLTREQIEFVMGTSTVYSNKQSKSVHNVAPGMMEFHYAPKTPLKVLKVEDLKQFVDKSDSWLRYSVLCFSPKEEVLLQNLGFKQIFVLSRDGDLIEAAANLYEQLRRIDKMKINGVICIPLDTVGLGVAINDRLNKAQHGIFD